MSRRKFKIDYDVDTDGYTQPSLKRLKNEICRRVDHEVCVFKVRTEEILCGFLIMDYTTEEAVWTGDGFRTDGGGEGGAGYNTAMLFLKIMNIETVDISWGRSELLYRPDALDDIINGDEQVLSVFEVLPNGKLSDRFPVYVRGNDFT